jgi:hypothetical protein
MFAEKPQQNRPGLTSFLDLQPDQRVSDVRYLTGPEDVWLEEMS